jgi:hypothetical protein
MNNKLPDYLNDKTPQKKGRDQEDKARKNINSGAVWFDKGDLSTKDYLIDVKRCKKSHTISVKAIKKLFPEAVQQGKDLAFLIYIGDYTVQAVVKRNPEKRRKG